MKIVMKFNIDIFMDSKIKKTFTIV